MGRSSRRQLSQNPASQDSANLHEYRSPCCPRRPSPKTSFSTSSPKHDGISRGAFDFSPTTYAQTVNVPRPVRSRLLGEPRGATSDLPPDNRRGYRRKPCLSRDHIVFQVESHSHVTRNQQAKGFDHNRLSRQTRRLRPKLRMLSL